VSGRTASGVGTTLFQQPANDTAHKLCLATSMVLDDGQTYYENLGLR
jgi:hypothetical protein